MPQVCEGCGQEYCFQHATAHVGKSCREFMLAIRKAEADNAKFMRGHTLCCPWCSKPTVKAGGCNVRTVPHLTSRHVLLAWPRRIVLACHCTRPAAAT